ncbi:MAG: imidazoleglycerol-phosphate dehydratase HisB [Candidatus Omnitrophota bacterium]|nr:MAG: imidazoleglycerol-phosphate dehydratase HisB [Candidatus Omnitrophota bacterium]
MRKVKIERKTKEVEIKLVLSLKGKGNCKIDTGVGFLNHLLSSFSLHGRFDLEVKARGDIEVDVHHTNEDIGICLGRAFFEALGDKRGIKRFSHSFICMDETLTRCVVDLGGRPFFKIKPKNIRVYKATYSFLHFKQFWKAFTDNAKIALHLDILEGEDLHHILEASTKAIALALKEAIKKEDSILPTTKAKFD